jgi:O-antigen/teichoic acid export membrane protein
MASISEVTTDIHLPAPAIPSLRSNFSWTLVGNIVYSACQWGMISALAKMGNAALVGRFALGLAITAPVFMFTNLQLRAVQATDARSEFAFSDYFTLRLMASLSGLFAIALLVVLGRYDTMTGAVILLIGLSKMIESLSDVIAGLLQKMERLDRVSISLMLKGTFSLLAFGAAFWLTHNLIAAVAALVFVWFTVFVLYDLRQGRNMVQGNGGFFAFRWQHLRRLAQVSAPLGIVMTLISLNVNIPRYILEHALGPSELGIFASLAYLLVAISLVINALGQSVSSRLARMFAEGNSAGFRKLLGKLLTIAGTSLILGVPAAQWIGRPLLSFIYRPEYGEHVSLFVIMVATAGVSAVASFLGYGMTAARTFRMQVPVVGVSTFTTVLFSIVLIPRMGSIGAAYALLSGACVLLVGCAVVVHGIIRRLTMHGQGCGHLAIANLPATEHD